MQVNDLLKCVDIAPLPKNTIAPDLKLGGEEYYNESAENHARGMEALGLII